MGAAVLRTYARLEIHSIVASSLPVAEAEKAPARPLAAAAGESAATTGAREYFASDTAAMAGAPAVKAARRVTAAKAALVRLAATVTAVLEVMALRALAGTVGTLDITDRAAAAATAVAPAEAAEAAFTAAAGAEAAMPALPTISTLEDLAAEAAADRDTLSRLQQACVCGNTGILRPATDSSFSAGETNLRYPALHSAGHKV
jgi:hypothetical protein